MTHLHSDSNDGFATFLPTDATIFVNARATGVLATSFAQGKAKAPHVIGVSDRIALVAGKPGSRDRRAGGERAHRVRSLRLRRFDAHGLRRRSRDDGPLPDALGPRLRHQGLARHPGRDSTRSAPGVSCRRGEIPTAGAAPEIEKTRRYLTSMLAFLVEKKKQNAPEARVSGELADEKLGELLPARAQRAQRAFGLPPAPDRRDDPAGERRRETRGEVTPDAPATFPARECPPPRAGSAPRPSSGCRREA